MPTPAACTRRACMLVATLLLFHGAADAAPQPLRISGNGSGRGGIQMLADAFEREHPGVVLAVLPPLGSTGAIKALIDGALDMVVSSRPPDAGELARADLVTTEYARTPFVVAVHAKAGITALSSAQLATLYRNTDARFPNGLRARPVMRLADANGTRLMQEFSAEVGQAVQAAQARPGMLRADTESDAADLVERTPGAFAGCTLALIESERRALVPLAIDGKVPSVANLANGSYPYGKSLYLIIRRRAAPATLQFARFVTSPAARQLLQAHGHWVR